MVGVVEGVGRGLVDRHGSGLGAGSRLLAGVYLERLETVAVGHVPSGSGGGGPARDQRTASRDGEAVASFRSFPISPAGLAGEQELAPFSLFEMVAKASQGLSLHLSGWSVKWVPDAGRSPSSMNEGPVLGGQGRPVKIAGRS